MTRLFHLVAAAGLALGAGACGEVKGNPDAAVNGPDASTIDGSVGVPDASPDAQTIGPVSVHVLSLDNDGMPEPGATVLFYAPDGTLADRKLTDSSGDATAELEAGGSITVVRLRTNNTYFTTVAGVKPNDTINVGRPASSGGSSQGTLRVILPAHANATYYTANAGCGYGGGTATTFNMNLYGCNGNGSVVGRFSYNGSDYFVGQNNVPLVVDGTVDLSGQTWQWINGSGFNVSITNIPAGINYLGAIRRTLGSHGSIYDDYADGVQDPPAGSTALAMGYPPGIGAGTLVEVNLQKYDGNSSQKQIIAAKLDSVPSSYGLDLASLLPWVEQPVLSGADVTWTGGAGGDGVVVDLRMNGSVQPYTYADWRLVLPPGTTSFTLPALPTDLDGRWNVTDASYYGDTTIIELETVDGYDQFRSEMEPYVQWVYWQMTALLGDAPAATAAVSTTFQGD